jgi:hypothetical protein
MKTLKKSLLVLVLVSVFGALPASAAMLGAVGTEVVGGINDLFNNNGNIGWMVGGGLDFWLGPAADLDVRGLYLSRSFSGGGSLNYVQIPAVLYLHMGPMFSIGAGGFYDAPLSSGATNNDGLIGAVRLKFPMMPVFVDGRFLYGLNTSGTFSSNTNELQVAVGLHF